MASSDIQSAYNSLCTDTDSMDYRTKTILPPQACQFSTWTIIKGTHLKNTAWCCTRRNTHPHTLKRTCNFFNLGNVHEEKCSILIFVDGKERDNRQLINNTKHKQYI